MGGRKITEEELKQIGTLTGQRLTYREIADRLDRSEASIKNIRYRKNLAMKELLAKFSKLSKDMKKVGS
jgi:IS30 family transposase